MDSRLIRDTRSMAEFFSACINSSSGMNLYGTIIIHDGCGGQLYMFNRTRDDCEYKQPGENIPLSLIGPSRYISGFHQFCIFVHLKDKDSEEEIQDFFAYNSLSPLHERLLDVPTCEVFDGKCGSSLRLYYSVFKNAVAATLNILLTKIPLDMDAANVEGQIIAQNSFTAETCDSMEYQTVLKEWGLPPVVVSPGELIPLSRRVVSVPAQSILCVSAILRDEFGNEIANGVANFRPKISGSAVKTISGSHGEIRVKITWRDL